MGSGDGGPALAAGLSSPEGIVLDSSGNLYFTNGVDRIRMVSGSPRLVTAVAGISGAGFFGDGGLATLARFSAPGDLAIDGQKNIYVADYRNKRIRPIDPNTRAVQTGARVR